MFPERTWCCTHKSPTAKCRTFPNPSRWTIPIAAVAPDLIATWPHKQKSFNIDCSPIPSVAALTTAAQDQDSHNLGPRFHEFPLWIFLVECHPAKSASPNTSSLLSNWVYGYLLVIRGYLIVYGATLLRAVRSRVRGEAIFRINSFTEYKRTGLSIARKLNLAATLWNNNSSPVRRSSYSLTSSGRSCHFAVLRNPLIWLALGPPTSSVPGVATPLASVNPKVSRRGKHAAGLPRTRFSIVAMSVFCPRNSLSVTATNRVPESPLCSTRMHLATNSVHAFAPGVGPH